MTAVVILHYNRIQLTADCCASLREQTVAPSRIIVIDNASPNHSTEDLKSTIPSACQVIRTSSNFGFSGGMNVGIREALKDSGTDSVLVLNNDTRCPPELIEKLRVVLASDPSAGIVGCDMEGANGGGSMAAAYRLSPFFAFPVPVADAAQGAPFDYLQGSCLLVRREVFEAIGLFDESFFFFCEDADFCLRARHAGWELAVAPNVKLFHLGSATIGSSSANQSDWYRAGMRLFLAKWRTWPTVRAFPAFAFRLLADTVKFRFSAVAGSFHGYFHPNLAADTRLKDIKDFDTTVAVNTLFLVPGQVGGSETYLRNTLAEMAKAAPRTRFIVFTNKENHNTLLADLSRFPNVLPILVRVTASAKFFRLFAELLTVPSLTRRYRADILWNPGNIAPFSPPCPMVTSILDMQYKRFPEDYSALYLMMMKVMTAIAIRRSSRLVTISEFSKSEIVKFAKVPADRIAVAPLAVSADFAANATGTDPENGETMLCVANSYPHKRVEDAVAVFAEIANDFPRLKLRLIGQPRLGEKKVTDAIAALPEPVRARIERIYRLPYAELVKAVKSASVFFFPSCYEGFGLPVLEALRAGTPVVACRAAATPEIADRYAAYYEKGNLNAAANAVKAPLQSPPTQTDRAASASHAASFTWERTARTTLDTLTPRRKITVVTPCYNSAATISVLLDSIDAQAENESAFELEHIVMDGGSKDETLRILETRAKPWRKVISQKDKGPADAINHGFALATGDYVAWLNADDAYAPRALLRAMRALEANPKASFAFGRCPIVDENDTEIRRPVTRFKEFFFPFQSRFMLQILNYVSQPASLFRKSALDAAGPLRLGFKAAWDYDLLLRLLHQGPAVRIKGTAPVAFFRWTPGSISGSNFRRQFSEELNIAMADAGRFSLQALLHRCVRIGIVTIYSIMTK